MKKFSSVLATSTASLLFAVSIIVPSVSAATTKAPTANPSNTGQALEIAPPVISLTANPGQTLKVQISLRDISSGNLLVSSQFNDFVAAGEDGTPKIILNDDSNNPYSMKTWFAPVAPLLMIPRQIQSLPVTINVTANASPGGHYGVIRFTGTAPELHGTGVSLSASLGSLVLITVSGKTTETMSVVGFSVNHNGKTGSVLESGPLQFVERLKNSGNVHEQPTGQVTVSDMFGKTIGAVNVNVPPRNILPQSIRKFDQPFDSTVIGTKKLFGRYHATLKVTYGATKQVLTASIVFWVIPYKLIGIAIVVIVGGFFALRYLIKYYNRRIITKAQKSTRTK